MLDPEMLEDTCPLDNGRHGEGGVLLAALSIGTLNILPLEILQNILVDELDLASLTNLRSVSRGFRSTLDSLPQYNAIISHAPSSIRALLSLEIASFFPCKALYRVLCEEKCAFCGDFGANLYLLTCNRVCYQCLIDTDEARTFNSGAQQKPYGH
jgi:hypothetical protein